MGQLIHTLHRNVSTTFEFMNRTKGVPLGFVVDHGRLREELEHCRTLRHTPQSLHYLMGTYEYDDPMFVVDFVKFMSQMQLPEFEIDEAGTDGQLSLRFHGPWANNTYWEIHAMQIVNQLYFEARTKNLSRFEYEAVEAEGRLRLLRKIKTLKQHPRITFSEFGTRRRFSFDWQDYVVGVLREEFEGTGQFLGTSNVLLAQKYGVKPMGTNAHELPMGYSGIYYDEDENDPTYSSRQVLHDWEGTYKQGLTIMLPDTFGSDWFFKNVVTSRQLRYWKGSRQDSGDPVTYAYNRIAEYNAIGVTPTKKIIVFADGQKVETMVEIDKELFGKIGYTFGPGTDFTNDLGFPALSIVAKLVEANGHEVCKLSENIEKATGPKRAIERAKRLVGYTNTFAEQPVY
jgi:nicotinate phosphoribosyltransferase